MKKLLGPFVKVRFLGAPFLFSGASLGINLCGANGPLILRNTGCKLLSLGYTGRTWSKSSIMKQWRGKIRETNENIHCVCITSGFYDSGQGG